ncbi:hypothetical protein TNCV_1066901 [Trichonephila clavipes]|uniref:Uncharacterized protein n=1 Tax=Trichonephila clavipes TaxID=2585209 RepID=A0A8X6V056_TRICX|nr:hypothetical protein TNCV_1066901 [Trichonephila clavipes]
MVWAGSVYMRVLTCISFGRAIGRIKCAQVWSRDHMYHTLRCIFGDSFRLMQDNAIPLTVSLVENFLAAEAIQRL